MPCIQGAFVTWRTGGGPGRREEKKNIYSIETDQPWKLVVGRTTYPGNARPYRSASRRGRQFRSAPIPKSPTPSPWSFSLWVQVDFVPRSLGRFNNLFSFFPWIFLFYSVYFYSFVFFLLFFFFENDGEDRLCCWIRESFVGHLNSSYSSFYLLLCIIFEVMIKFW